MTRLYTSIAGEGPTAQPHNHALDVDLPDSSVMSLAAQLMGPETSIDVTYSVDTELFGGVLARNITVNAGVVLGCYQGVLCARGGNVVNNGRIIAYAPGPRAAGGATPGGPGSSSDGILFGGAGGDGGDGGDSGGFDGGRGGVSEAFSIEPLTLLMLMSSATAPGGSSGAGGGASGPSNSDITAARGGRGGSGGGRLLIVTTGTVTGSGSLEAAGDDGEDGADGFLDSGGGGGGGAGGGGAVAMVAAGTSGQSYSVPPGSAGSGGAGNGTGASGAAGQAGQPGHVYLINIETGESTTLV